MYWCIALSDETRNKIIRVAKSFSLLPTDWDIYTDHITLIHSSNPNFDVASNILCNFDGHSIPFRLTGVGISDRAVAFKVDTRTANAVSHITLAVAPGAKPVESNDIEQWDKLYCNETFCGTLIFKD